MIGRKGGEWGASGGERSCMRKLVLLIGSIGVLALALGAVARAIPPEHFPVVHVDETSSIPAAPEGPCAFAMTCTGSSCSSAAPRTRSPTSSSKRGSSTSGHSHSCARCWRTHKDEPTIAEGRLPVGRRVGYAK